MCRSKRCGCCAFVDFVALIPGKFEVDPVRIEVCGETAGVPSSFVVPGGVCIAGGCVVFSVLSLSAYFGGVIVHLRVYAFARPVSVFSSSSSPVTAQEGTMILRMNITIKIWKVWKEIVLRKGGDVGRRGGSGEMVVV